MSTIGDLIVILLAWTIPAMHLRVLRAGQYSINWFDHVQWVSIAVFVTCQLPLGQRMFAKALHPSGVYLLTNVAVIIVTLGLSRYVFMYQRTLRRAHQEDVTVPGVVAARITIPVALVLALVTTVIIDGVFMHRVINANNIRPLSVALALPPLVASRLVLCGTILSVFIVAILVPLHFIINQPPTSQDVQSIVQGGPLHFILIGVIGLIVVLNILANAASSMLYLWTGSAAIIGIYDIITYVLVGSSVVIMVLLQTRHGILGAVQSLYLLRKLAPLHALLRELVPGVFLNLEPPSALDVVRRPDDVQLALTRFVAEITDARLSLFAVSTSVCNAQSSLGLPLTTVAEQEGAYLSQLHSGGPKGVPLHFLQSHQTIDYFLAVAQTLRLQRSPVKVDKAQTYS